LFTVACLKHALKYLEESLGESEKVRGRQLLNDEEINAFRSGLFEIREEMLGLMKKYRA